MSVYENQMGCRMGWSRMLYILAHAETVSGLGHIGGPWNPPCNQAVAPAGVSKGWVCGRKGWAKPQHESVYAGDRVRGRTDQETAITVFEYTNAGDWTEADPALAGTREPGLGSPLTRFLRKLPHLDCWTQITGYAV